LVKKTKFPTNELVGFGASVQKNLKKIEQQIIRKLGFPSHFLASPLLSLLQSNARSSIILTPKVP